MPIYISRYSLSNIYQVLFWKQGTQRGIEKILILRKHILKNIDKKNKGKINEMVSDNKDYEENKTRAWENDVGQKV